MTSSDVEHAWKKVATPPTAQALEGRPAPGLGVDAGVLLAVDGLGLRHLLIPARPEDEAPRQPNTKGFEISIEELRVADAEPKRYYDVACQDATMHASFTVVAAEILDELALHPEEPRKVLQGVLARWRWFWGSPAVALSDEEIVGLFGELWLMEFWLGPVDLALLAAWTGPHGDRHDFKWPEASVEVKATGARSDGSATHRISSLDQLDEPEQGALYLFSLRVRQDPIATHTLVASVDRMRHQLEFAPQLLHAFDERLSLAGYTPADRERYDTPFRIVAEELYRVEGDFPRLTAATFGGAVPDGVDNIAYSVDLAACAAWRVASHPGKDAQFLRDSLRP